MEEPTGAMKLNRDFISAKLKHQFLQALPE
jgi:hypothetical protein